MSLLRKKVVLDTNILLDNPEVLSRNDLEFILPYVVLAELDKLKRNPDLSYTARNSIKLIMEGYKKGTVTIIGVPTDLETNDEKIVQTAKDTGSLLWSRDIGAKVIALTKGVELFEDDVQEYDKAYIGYRYLEVPQEWYYNFICKVNEAQHPEVEVPLEDLLKDNPITLNEYTIFKPDDGSLNSIIFRKSVEKFVHVSSSNKIFRTLSKEGRKVDIEFLSDEQVCAFDAVFNTDTPLCIIQGTVGSSKTLISTLGALCRVAGSHSNKKYSQILVTRPTMPTHRQWEIGFVPGSAEDKMSHWLTGFTSNLEFLFNHSQEDYEKEVAKGVFTEFFQPISLDSVQGSSFNGKILLVDECYHPSTEILTEKGWYRFDELPKDLKVLQVNQDTGEGSFVEPIRYIKKPYTGDLVHATSHNGVDLLVTPNHELLIYKDEKPKKVKASELVIAGYNSFKCTANVTGDTDDTLTPYEVLAIATQADGYIEGEYHKSVAFSFAKERKVARLLEACDRGGFKVTENKSSKAEENRRAQRRFRIVLDRLISKDMTNTFDLTKISTKKAQEIVKEVLQWDGYIPRNDTTRGMYCTTVKSQVDFIHAVCVIAGYKTKLIFREADSTTNRVRLYRLLISFNTNSVNAQSVSKTYVPYDGDVYCVTVPDGNIVVRRNGKAVVCGNCQLLDVDTLKQVMTRTANGSKLVLILDVNQAYGAWRGREGYKKLLPHAKNNPLISFVNLQNIYRSELTAMVNDIFKN